MDAGGGETIFLRKHVFDKLDAQRVGHIEDYLSDQEREFLWLVRNGDLDGIKAFLNTVSINPDCCDYRGQRALDIAVMNGDLELVVFLLDTLPVTTLHFYCAVLRAVFENEPEMLQMLLERADGDPRLKEVIEGGAECGKCLPEVAATNLTPTMAAATAGFLDITRMLLERGYTVQTPHSRECFCCESCRYRVQNGETLTESMSRINAYRALASPTYLILTSEDPILSSFELSRELAKLSIELPEHQREYRELSKECSQFAAALLNQCRNTEEVQSVLVQRKGFVDPRPHRFSRLHLAVQCGQKEFVTHASCQQVLRSMWVETVGSWYSWPFRSRALYVIKHACLTPIVSLAFIFLPRPKVLGPLRVPLNRFIYSATAYLCFLSLLMVTLLNDRRYEVNSPVTWTEMAVGCFVVGYSWDIFTNLISVGVGNYLRSWWSVFDLILFSLFLLTEVLWFSVFLVNILYGYDASNRMCWGWYHPILLGEGIYAAASVMAFTRLMVWFQVNSKLGPLGTSIKYMIGDVFQFFMLFFIIMLAFATGINSIYKNYKGSTKIDGDEIIEQPEAFLTLKNTFKNLFWAIFGMGEPDFAQIIVGTVENATVLQSEHIFTEGVGYSLWGLWHMATVVVLLNMLIAMMTESYQRVQTNSDLEWKFACSTLWLSVFDSQSIVPPPFNLVPSMHRITVVIRWLIASARGSLDAVPGKVSWSVKRCFYWESEIDASVRKMEEEQYERLIVQLIRRYLHCQDLQCKVSTSTITDDLKQQLKEEITSELRRSFGMPKRSTTRKQSCPTNTTKKCRSNT